MTMIKITDPNIIKTKRLSANFMAKEFACRHCGIVLIDQNLVNQLEQFRSRAGNNPIQITSGYRCPYWNQHEGGASSSLHIYGKAVDFEMFNRLNAVEMFNLAVKTFNRVGLYQSNRFPNQAYMHVDLGNSGTYWLSWMKVVGKTPEGKPIMKRTYVYFKDLMNMYAMMKADKDRDWFNMVI